MDKIIITDLKASGIIGVKSPERRQAQEILVNLILFTDTRKAAVSDSIDDTINYSTVTKKLIERIKRSDFYTVEALAEDLARFCILEFNVETVKLKVEKPQAVKTTRRVGVEITRCKKDYIS